MRLIDADRFEDQMNEELLPELIKEYGKEEALKGLHFSFRDCICNIQCQPTVDVVERIEHEKMKDLAEEYKFEYECLFEDLKDIINNVLPNRVEVVRCKDCQHWCNEREDGGFDCCTRAIVNRFKPTDFCSYGERKNED